MPKPPSTGSPGTRGGRRPPTRVPRHTLNRRRIVDTAVALIDEAGLDACTMPALAARLGVGTMSLYRHVETKDDLLGAVAEHLVKGVAVPPGADDDWEGRVVGYLRSLREQAVRHPALARILADRGLTATPVFDHLEIVLGVMRAAGFSRLDAVRAFYGLLTYVFGYVLWELPRVRHQPSSAYAAAWDEALDALPPEDFPHLGELREELATSASEDQFEYGLAHLVEALRAHAGGD